MPLISKWEFDKESKCFNCHEVAIQKIEMIPSETVVTCTNCGAERHYAVHASFEGMEKPDFEADGMKRKYDLWKFMRNDICSNCFNRTDNEITIDEYKAAAVCPLCLFTRLYKFSMFVKP